MEQKEEGEIIAVASIHFNSIVNNEYLGKEYLLLLIKWKHKIQMYKWCLKIIYFRKWQKNIYIVEDKSKKGKKSLKSSLKSYGQMEKSIKSFRIEI